MLCVPDAEISAAAAAVAGAAPLIGHTSGATPLSALEPAAAEHFGLHPLQTFSGRRRTPAASPAALCRGGLDAPPPWTPPASWRAALGMVPFELADDQRAAYHAAASIASNFLVTLEAAAEELAAAAGLAPDEARAAARPARAHHRRELGRARPSSARSPGPSRAGDEPTVARQRAAVRRSRTPSC